MGLTVWEGVRQNDRRVIRISRMGRTNIRQDRNGRPIHSSSIEKEFELHKRTFDSVNKRSRRCKHAAVLGSDGPTTHSHSYLRRTATAIAVVASALIISVLRTHPSPASRAPPIPPAGPTVAPGPLTSTAPTSSVTSVPEATAGPVTPSTSSTTPVAGPPTPTSRQPPGIWTVAFGGDTLLTRPVRSSTNPFAGIRPPLEDADLAIVNLETAVSARGRAQVKTFTFRSAPSFADTLAQVGIDVVSLANNHSLDFGIEALDDTIDNLDRVNVSHVGAGRNLSEALAPAEFEIAGTTVAVLGASQIIPNGAWLATPTRPGIASAGKHAINRQTQELLAAVRTAKATNDVVIVILHWGIEGDPCPSAVQQKLGRLLVDAGASAVLGAHPHILQPVVPVTTLDGDAVIAYSLGNFIWDPRGGPTGDTGVLQLRFDGARLVGVSFAPHRLNSNGWAQAVDGASATGRTISARVGRACPGAPGVSSWTAFP